MATSFFYEDLVSHVQKIQNQTVEIENVLNNRQKNRKRKRDELRSRSLVFIDPYGNQIINEHMDHELIHKVIKKYKKDYVPNYLQNWIQIGATKQNIILPLYDSESKSTVSQYANGYQFTVYGLVTVWIGYYDSSKSVKFIPQVLLTDTIEKIKIQIAEIGKFTNIEFKSCKINQNGGKANEKHWNEGVALKLEDTISSCRLYEKNRIIMAKVIKEETETKTSSIAFPIVVKTLTANTVSLLVNPEMNISTIKELIQSKIGAPSDQQRLIYAGKQLEDERTLEEYNIELGCPWHLILRLRGGMFHPTSGRQDFHSLPYDGTDAVKNILAFKLKETNDVALMSSADLQNSVLQAQTDLTILYHSIRHLHTPNDLPNVKSILLPTAVDRDEDDVFR